MFRIIFGFFLVLWIGSMVTDSVKGAFESKVSKERKANDLRAEKEEKMRKGFHCLSSWNGAHSKLEQAVKASLRDPDSYKHGSTKIAPVSAGQHYVIMEYRAKNGFGGYNQGVVTANIYQSNCEVAKIISATN